MRRKSLKRLAIVDPVMTSVYDYVYVPPLLCWHFLNVVGIGYSTFTTQDAINGQLSDPVPSTEIRDEKFCT